MKVISYKVNSVLWVFMDLLFNFWFLLMYWLDKFECKRIGVCVVVVYCILCLY